MAAPRLGLALGLLTIHLVLLVFLAFCIWGESAEISLVTLTPFWKAVTNACRAALAGQVNLAIPVLIWILATFRREDRQAVIGHFETWRAREYQEDLRSSNRPNR